MSGDHVQEIYNFAEEHGYNIIDFTSTKITQQRKYLVSIELEVPEKTLAEEISEIERED